MENLGSESGIAAKRDYEPPQLQVVGTLADLTQANFQNDNSDFNFFGLPLGGLS